MAKRSHLRLYDGRTRALKGILSLAKGIGYKAVLNDLWEGHFALPATDPQNALIAAHDLVEISDGLRGRIMMRVVEQPEDEGGQSGTWVPYSLESVSATLMDDHWEGYAEIGGAGMRTAACIAWVLAQQSVPRWVLGDCELDYGYSYVMQGNNLLALLTSLSTCIVAKHRWEFDTSAYPWRVHLRAVSGNRECGILYRRNLGKVRRGWNARGLVNRLYCAGYGEGVNLLTIRSVNGGLPYVQDDESVARYGVKAGPYSDPTIEDATTLKAAALAALQRTAWPTYTYRTTVLDLYEATGLDFDRLQEGRVVWIYDRERGMDVEAQIVSLTRPDVAATPYAAEVEISETVQGVGDALSSMATRLGIAELYSQGATQIFADRFADNADAAHPAVWDIYIPEDARTINSIRIKIRMEKFRGYTMAAAAGGGSTQTSSSGGSVGTSSASPTATVNSNAQTVSQYYNGNTSTVSSHYHEIPNHYHVVTISGSAFAHTHTGGGHAHNVTLPAHEHAISYGIYEGPEASGYTLWVDGSPIPSGEIVDGIVDIAPWMGTDDSGRITRGVYHTIELYPTGLTRVVMERFVRMYIQSIGGTVL